MEKTVRPNTKKDAPTDLRSVFFLRFVFVTVFFAVKRVTSTYKLDKRMNVLTPDLSITHN